MHQEDDFKKPTDFKNSSIVMANNDQTYYSSHVGDDHTMAHTSNVLFNNNDEMTMDMSMT